MSRPHRIRLRGPWRLRVISKLESGSDVSSERTIEVSVPDKGTSILGPGFRGDVEYARHFNCPTNLDAGTQVFLWLEHVSGAATATLNGNQLGTASWRTCPRRFEISEHLLPRNELLIRVEIRDRVEKGDEPSAPSNQGHGGWLGEVRLEIG